MRLARVEAGIGHSWGVQGSGKRTRSAGGEVGAAAPPGEEETGRTPSLGLGEAGTEPPLQMGRGRHRVPYPRLLWSSSDMPQLPLGVTQEVPGPVRKADLCLQVCLPASVRRWKPTSPVHDVTKAMFVTM